MQVDDVFPRRNLPDLSEEWGRTVENGLVDNIKGVDQVSQGLKGLNRNVASSLQNISRQLNTLSEQQDTIQSVQNDILTTQLFLLNQTQYTQNGGSTSTSVGSAGSISYFSFDPAYDVSLNVETSSTGVLSCTVGSYIEGVGVMAGVGIEVVGFSIPDYFTSVAFLNAVGSSSRQTGFFLTGNTTYTLQTRRWYTGSGGSVAFSNQSLSVTKIGI